MLTGSETSKKPTLLFSKLKTIYPVRNFAFFLAALVFLTGFRLESMGDTSDKNSYRKFRLFDGGSSALAVF